jgi:Ca2+-binding RTX toxin-like protein
MKKLTRLQDVRVGMPVRLAASAAAVAAVVAGAAGTAAGQNNAAHRVRAHAASYALKGDEVKRPKLQHGELRVKGTNADDRITLRLQAGAPGIVQVVAGDDGSEVFGFPRADIASIAVDARRGDDLVRIDDGNGTFTDSIPTTLDGGDGNDTLAGGQGAETLLGGDGNDTLDGNKGNDRAAMGAGDDTFVWDPGDGSDTIEGQEGADTMVFNGADLSEKIDVSANGNRVRFFRDIATITMDTAGVERIDFNALGGADTVTVNDLTGTDVSSVNVNLAGTLGAGDGQADRVVVNATDGDDKIDVSGDAAEVKVSGLAPTVAILNPEAAKDRLELDKLTGTDSVDSGGLGAGAIQLFVNGALVP